MDADNRQLYTMDEVDYYSLVARRFEFSCELRVMLRPCLLVVGIAERRWVISTKDGSSKQCKNFLGKPETSTLSVKYLLSTAACSQFASGNKMHTY